MIKRKDILDFFDLEAEAAKKSWEALMNLPVKDRIRKRKAIKEVYLDRDFIENTEDGEKLYKIQFGSNLSDFKEGDYLFLHEEGSMQGIKCTLFSFEGDDTIYISVSNFTRIIDLESFYGKPLLLDKDMVDLRQNVYYNFTAVLPTDTDYWKELFINKKPEPVFVEDTECRELFEDLVKNENILANQREAILNSLYATNYYLIQGPPGTGKSFVSALIIFFELLYYKHKTIVIGPNHLAINNVLGKVFEMCPNLGKILHFCKVGRPYNAPSFIQEYEGEKYTIDNIFRINSVYLNHLEGPWLIGLTPHSLYTSRARFLDCDTLVIDEAGQMTIPLALMGMIKAKKVILAGDHKQLPPIISSDEIPDYMKKSAFETMMTKKNCTLLDVSFRMCEPICNFVSDLFYEGKVKAMKKGCGNMIICQDPLYSFNHPVVIHHVDDHGEQTSEKEAVFIADTIAEYLKKGLPADEVAVLSPFRAQASCIRRIIRKHPSIKEEQAMQIAVDTIDKMQGQEREVIILTLVAGDLDYMTEMADFLYNPNKLNVAFSRAKSKLIIVGNIEQLRCISSTGFPHIEKMLNSKHITMV